MEGAIYRRCRVCGEEWNVSKVEPGIKQYTCPRCEWTARKRNISIHTLREEYDEKRRAQHEDQRNHGGDHRTSPLGK
jgi:hypothetical protein